MKRGERASEAEKGSVERLRRDWRHVILYDCFVFFHQRSAHLSSLFPLPPPPQQQPLPPPTHNGLHYWLSCLLNNTFLFVHVSAVFQVQSTAQNQSFSVLSTDAAFPKDGRYRPVTLVAGRWERKLLLKAYMYSLGVASSVFDRQCDGEPDCDDRSDEDPKRCRNPFVPLSLPYLLPFYKLCFLFLR